MRAYKKDAYPYADSTQVPWQLTNESFQFLTASFAVGEAKEWVLHHKHKIVALPLGPLRAWISEPEPGGVRLWSVRIDWARVETANLEIPILAATLDRTILPIDGWHRIALGIRKGLDALPCVCLTATETKNIRF